MVEKKPKLSEIVRDFMVADAFHSRVLNRTFRPVDDLRFSEEANTFYLRYLTPAPHFAPFKEGELSKTSTLKRIIHAWILENHPSIDPSPQLLDSFLTLLTLTFELKAPAFSENTAIAFNDETEFHWPSKTILPRTSEALLAFDFPSSALDTSTPLFDSFLSTAFPQETQLYKTYILEIIGYLLLPPKLTKVPAVFYLYGVTGAGKSVFLDILEAFFPSYAKSALSLHELTDSKYALAHLAGKFINIVDEDESEYVNGGKLKALTSMRPMTAERKYEQPFTFTSYAKFIFASNQLPTLKNLDDAIERRLHLVEFSHRVPPSQVDIHLIDKIKQTELAGILGQALLKATELLASNITFHPPEELILLKQEFFRESSSVLSFIDACYQITIDPQNFTSSTTLYEDYLLYCRKYNKSPLSHVKFGLVLKNMPGVLSVKGAKGVRMKSLVKRLDAPLLNLS